jgi:hypothetical protein
MRSRRTPMPGELPQLKVGIYVGRKLTSVVDLEDPREAFCRFYNEIAAGGRRAVPLPVRSRVKGGAA